MGNDRYTQGPPGLYGLSEPAYMNRQFNPDNPIGSILDIMARKSFVGDFNELTQDIAEEGAWRLEQIGSPEAMETARHFRDNPAGFIGSTGNIGGMAAIENALRKNWQQQQQREGMAQVMATMPEDATTRDIAKAAQPYLGSEKALDWAVKWDKAGRPDLGTLHKIMNPNDPMSSIYATSAQTLGREPLTGKERQAPAPSGMDIEWGPLGGVIRTRSRRGGAEGGMTTTTQSRLQGDVIDYTNRIARLRSIGDAFNPQFHKYGTKLWMAGSELYEKAMEGEETLTGEERELLENISAYRLTAYRELNMTLRELSGAAVNPSEAERLLEQIVDVGKHWWQGDSPTVARRKYEMGLMLASRAKARAVYMLKHPGDLSAGKYSLDQMYKLILERGVEEMQRLERELPGISKEALRARMNGVIVQEFGVSFDDIRDPKEIRRARDRNEGD